MSDPGRCLACDSGTPSFWREATAADSRASRQRYELWRCDACGTAMTVGRTVEDATALYRGGAYARTGPAVDALLEPLRALATRSALRALGELPAGAVVCDVGAGDGRLVRALRGRGHYAVGLDPFGSEDGPVPARLEEAAFEPESFDAVLFWHVLEHLEEPATTVAEAVRVLKRHGRVVVSVPNLDSLQARIGGDVWFHQDVPRHRLHLSRRGLGALLARCGLAIERLDTVCIDQDLLGMAQTLLNRVTRRPNAAFRALKEERPRGRAAASAAGLVPAGAIGTLLEAGAILAGRGGALVARARAQ